MGPPDHPWHLLTTLHDPLEPYNRPRPSHNQLCKGGQGGEEEGEVGVLTVPPSSPAPTGKRTFKQFPEPQILSDSWQTYFVRPANDITLPWQWAGPAALPPCTPGLAATQPTPRCPPTPPRPTPAAAAAAASAAQGCPQEGPAEVAQLAL
eukprot:262267-Pelagomonas_calceolata.AAC.6